MNVLIVDDDKIVSRSLATILSVQPDIEIAGCGSDGDEAVSLFDELAPDVLLMDIQMQGRDGLSAAEKILASHPDAAIVFLTTFADDEYIVRALKMGARGYLIKQDVSTIAPALRSVMGGQRVLEGEVLEKAVALGAGISPARDEGALAGLSERERDVVRLVADGLDNGEIARELFISDGTVRNHISAILAKLNLRNRTQIAVFYYRNCMG
ncbi:MULTISPECIES: response regulator [Atopobiaceae]|uniref:Two component transcriptional regulator, LuxR family n=1 Tax=Parafannyhessea umbonata TaxID=604330 RepID=A0A1H9R1N6_9ACTN|nr:MULTISPECIES: response regulator transcription factor [Atopobiaceae]SEH63031.1 two component transcriptional regulator, LuxR family [Parafannyhessea umbonata]SER66624.1 two component transcriptional regulator, LuxR family [Parafannyhessea umbonata]SJZ84568.1 two component transcriptional regulator, LuxR family [Olsenella sp. KH1P3]